MKIFVLLLVSTYFVGFTNGDATIHVNSTQDVAIMASPNLIHEGLTRDATLNCTFTHVDSDFSTVMSLILSKDSAGKGFRELAAINSVSRDQVVVKDALGAHISGYLGVHGQSYISYVWQYPGENIQGQYKCEAFGMDKIGHPRVSSAATEINDRTVDHDALLERLKDIDLAQQEQQKLLRNQDTQIQNLKSELANQKEKNDNIMSRLNGSRDALIAASSSTFRGHTYHISKLFWRHFDFTESLCNLFGGYLAKVDDQSEFNFIADFIRKSGIKDKRMFISGTEEGHQGKWTYLGSGSNIGYLKWGPSQPDGDDCLSIHPNTGPSMDAMYCRNAMYNDGWHRFICEVYQ